METQVWGWLLGVISQGILILLAIYGAVISGNWLDQILQIVIPAAILAYLLTPQVRWTFFKR